MFVQLLKDIGKLCIAYIKEYGLHPGKTKADRAEWFYHYVPRAVHSSSVLCVMDLLSRKGTSKKQRQSHLKANVAAFEEYRKRHPADSLLEWQADMKGLCYGSGYTADYNACEVIAVYNAIADLCGNDEVPSFPDLLSRFEAHGIVRSGAFGTSISALDRYFQEMGFATVLLFFERENAKEQLRCVQGNRKRFVRLTSLQEVYDGFVLTSYNDKENLGAGIHTMYISKKKNRFTRHNDGKKQMSYFSLQEAVEDYQGKKSGMLSLIALRREATMC